MKTVSNFVAVSLGLSALASVCEARTLTIGTDNSGSSLVRQSPEFARQAGQYVAGRLEKQELGSWVRIRRFGERGDKNLANATLRITRQSRPAQVAKIVGQHIAGLPNDPSKPDKQSNILAFLEYGSFDCENGGVVILITDGVEDSSTLSEKRFLAGKPLPAPAPGLLKNCELVMFGLGKSKHEYTRKQKQTIRSAWERWSKAAGVSKFTAIIDP